MIPAFLVLVLFAVLGLVALPQLFGFFIGIQDAGSGVSGLVQQFSGRLPVVIFLALSIPVVLLLVAAARK